MGAKRNALARHQRPRRAQRLPVRGAGRSCASPRLCKESPFPESEAAGLASYLKTRCVSEKIDGPSSTMSQPGTATISAFALANAHDRRTLSRRLLYAEITPVSREGRAAYYRIEDMAAVMAQKEFSPASGLQADHSVFLESAAAAAFSAACEALPVAVREFGGMTGANADKAAAQIWLILAARLGNYMNEGRPQASKPIEVPVPKAIREILAGLGSQCEVYRHETNHRFTVNDHGNGE